MRCFSQEKTELAGVVALKRLLDVVYGVTFRGFYKTVVNEGGDLGLFGGGLFRKNLGGADGEDKHVYDSYGVYQM